MDHSNKTHENHSHSGYGMYLGTWLTLLVLTALTVAVAGMRLGNLSVLAAILIASVKATIVTLFFMHLKSESPTLKMMVVVCLVTLAIFIGITFTDYSFR